MKKQSEIIRLNEENKAKLREKILRSKELTAVEKRYLEGLVNHQRNGRWVCDAQSGEIFCSRCDWIPTWSDENYCANCGAKMSEVISDVE